MVLKRNGERKIPICVNVEPDVLKWMDKKSGDASRSNFANKIFKQAKQKDTQTSQEGDKHD